MGSVRTDADLVVESVGRTGCAVIVQNVTTNGGLDAALAAVSSQRAPPPLERIGGQDEFVESGHVEELFEHHRMRPVDIMDAARRAVATRAGQAARRGSGARVRPSSP